MTAVNGKSPIQNSGGRRVEVRVRHQRNSQGIERGVGSMSRFCVLLLCGLWLCPKVLALAPQAVRKASPSESTHCSPHTSLACRGGAESSSSTTTTTGGGTREGERQQEASNECLFFVHWLRFVSFGPKILCRGYANFQPTLTVRPSSSYCTVSLSSLCSATSILPSSPSHVHRHHHRGRRRHSLLL